MEVLKSASLGIPRTLTLILLIQVVTACSPALRSYPFDGALGSGVEARSSAALDVASLVKSPCAQSHSYIPDAAGSYRPPERVLRVNIHFMDHPDSLYNFKGEEGYRFVEGLLHSANNDLKHNNASWLPHGNAMPVLPVGYRMELTGQPHIPGDRGIYFHYDAEAAFYVHKGPGNTLYDRRALDRYGIGRDSILNIFIFPHHPDSLLSPTYPPGPVGVMVYNCVKMAGVFESRMPPWAYRGVLNHEVGHVFGLQHAWMADGCDDTPEHRQPCWNRTETPPCDTAASNNVMDYNALQNAWTPCQIGRIHQGMTNELHPVRKFVRPDWCILNEEHTIVVTDTAHWENARDLDGHLIIAPGALLTIHCRVSLPTNGKIIVQPGGRLVLHNARLHNACGDSWDGIEIQGQGKRKGQVTVLGTSTLDY